MKEPEEIIESKIAALLDAAGTGLCVVGALAPAPEGVEKSAPDSQIAVFADLVSQDMDWIGPGVPCTWSVRAAVHVAYADDKTGALFRDSCRAVRAALASLTGDDCAALSGDGFVCAAFILGATSTAGETYGGGGGVSKTYTATVNGRFIPPTETAQEAE